MPSSSSNDAKDWRIWPSEEEPQGLTLSGEGGDHGKPKPGKEDLYDRICNLKLSFDQTSDSFQIMLEGVKVKITKKELGSGGFGKVNEGVLFYYDDEYPVAVKFIQAIKTDTNREDDGQEPDRREDLKKEYDRYKKLSRRLMPKDMPKAEFEAKLEKADQFPYVFCYESIEEFDFMVMQKLGSNLSSFRKKENPPSLPKEVAKIGIKAVKILKELHSKGYVHADVKPQNLLGETETQGSKLFLIDLGLAVEWKSSGKHVEYDQRPHNFRGTVLYASIHAHLGRTGPTYGSRRDDLHSLAYTLLCLYCGHLPWHKNVEANRQEEKTEEREKRKIKERFDIYITKMLYSPRKLSRFWPQSSRKWFKAFLDDVMNLKFDDEPKYDEYIKWFNEIRTPPMKNEPSSYGGKRPSSSGEKRPSSGSWISVYNFQQAMKQRFHYNIPRNENVISRYIMKDNEEKLFVSSSSSYGSLLAWVAGEKTGHGSQEFKVLDKLEEKTEWIDKMWKKKYFITALTGREDGKWLVVMTKGAPFSKQTIDIQEFFPGPYLSQNWKKEGHLITSLASDGKKWAVVLSQSTVASQNIQQEIELDSFYPTCYPLEGLRYRCEQGYRISMVAASKEQIAFVLERPVEKDGKYTGKNCTISPTTTGFIVKPNSDQDDPAERGKQELIFTEDFPSKDIKKKWLEPMYVSSICYFREITVSKSDRLC